jgi:hypothetical protein
MEGILERDPRSAIFVLGSDSHRQYASNPGIRTFNKTLKSYEIISSNLDEL